MVDEQAAGDAGHELQYSQTDEDERSVLDAHRADHVQLRHTKPNESIIIVVVVVAFAFAATSIRVCSLYTYVRVPYLRRDTRRTELCRPESRDQISRKRSPMRSVARVSES